MIDALYRPVVELPDTGQRVELAGVDARVVVTDTAPDVIDAQWMDDREVTLTVTDDVDPERFARVLPAFESRAGELADRPTTATFSLPSRDVARARVARDAGFLPSSVLAVADLRRPGPPGDASKIVVRDARVDDAAAVAELWCEQADYEAGVGTLRTSEPIRAAIGAKAAACIAGRSTVLVAERDDPPPGQLPGLLAGAIVADVPADSEWVAGRLAVAPTSYLAMASTSAAVRSRGVGAALVAELHRRHRADGIAASALHYSAFNPLSVPFWSQRGYRPVVTIYARRVPHSRS